MMIPVGKVRMKNGALAKILARARRINTLNAALGDALARLGHGQISAQALNLRDGGKLVIAAANAANAARIRQILPSLHNALAEWEVRSIVVKVATPR